jgi:hypothetical protein
LTGSAKDDVLVWSAALREWIPAALSNLMPGAPIYNVLAPPFNASNTLAADDTAAVSSAILAANAVPGPIYLGSRHRFDGDLPALAGNNIPVIGRGMFNGGTILQFNNGPTGAGLRATNCQYPSFANLWITGSKAYSSNWAIRFSGCFRAAAANVLVSNMGSGVEVDRCTITEIEGVSMSDLYGPYAHYAHGLNAAVNHATKYRDCVVGTSFPLALTGFGRDWSQSVAFTAGDITKANGNLYQCLQSGVTAASGTGPSGLPTSNISTLRSTPIADGSVLWVFAMPAAAAYKQGSWSATFEVLDSGALQGSMGLLVEDDAPASGSEPVFSRSHNLQVDHAYDGGVHLLAGSSHDHQQLLAISTLAGTPLIVGAGVDGNWTFDDAEIFGGPGAGMTIARGDGIAHNLRMGALSSAASNSRDGIEVAAAVTDFTIANCMLGRMANGAVNNRYGASIAAGCDRYVLGNNRGYGVTGGFLNTPGTSSTRVLNGNIGTVT